MRPIGPRLDRHDGRRSLAACLRGKTDWQDPGGFGPHRISVFPVGCFLRFFHGGLNYFRILKGADAKTRRPAFTQGGIPFGRGFFPIFPDQIQIEILVMVIENGSAFAALPLSLDP